MDHRNSGSPGAKGDLYEPQPQTPGRNPEFIILGERIERSINGLNDSIYQQFTGLSHRVDALANAVEPNQGRSDASVAIGSGVRVKSVKSRHLANGPWSYNRHS